MKATTRILLYSLLIILIFAHLSDAHPNDLGWAWSGDYVEIYVRPSIKAEIRWRELIIPAAELRDMLIVAAEQAVEEWNRSGMHFKLVLKEDKEGMASWSNGIHEIYWVETGLGETIGRGWLKAECYSCIDLKNLAEYGVTAPPADADIWINSNSLVNFASRTTNDFDRARVIDDLRFTVLHELGHFLGLQHPFDATRTAEGEIISPAHTDPNGATVMQYSGHPIHLSQADKEAIRKKYPQTEFLPVIPTLTFADGSKSKKILQGSGQYFEFKGYDFTPNAKGLKVEFSPLDKNEWKPLPITVDVDSEGWLINPNVADPIKRRIAWAYEPKCNNDAGEFKVHVVDRYTSTYVTEIISPHSKCNPQPQPPTPSPGPQPPANNLPTTSIRVINPVSYEGPAPLPVTFDGSGSRDSDGTITSYEWDFGDGKKETTTSTQIKHTYATAGTFAAKLVVVDNKGGRSQPKSVTIRVTNATQLPSKAPYITIKKRVANAADEQCQFDKACDSVIDMTGAQNDGSRDVIFIITVTNTGQADANVTFSDDLAKSSFNCIEGCRSANPPFEETVPLKANGGTKDFRYRARYQGSFSQNDMVVINTVTVTKIGDYYDPPRGKRDGGYGELTASAGVRLTNTPDVPGPDPGIDPNTGCPYGSPPDRICLRARVRVADSVDKDQNCRLQDTEVYDATRLWINGATVPGTESEINDALMLDLVNMWVSDEPTYEDCVPANGAPPVEPPTPGNSRDLNGDGIYEDVDGNGVFNRDDCDKLARLLDMVRDDMRFDFHRDGQLNFGDVQACLALVGQKPPAQSTIKTDTVENEYFIFRRTIPTSANAGSTIEVTLEIVAKVSLEYAGYTEEFGSAFELLSKEFDLPYKAGFRQNLSLGQSFGVTYQLRVRSSGNLTIQGYARGMPSTSPSKMLTLNSSINSGQPASLQQRCSSITCVDWLTQIKPKALGKSLGFSMGVLPSGAVARLEVYTLDGRLIYEATSQGAAPNLSWSYETQSGQRAANGVYLYVITIAGSDGQSWRSQVKKLLVLR